MFQTVGTAVCVLLDCFLCRENQMALVQFKLGWYFTSRFRLFLIFNLLIVFPSKIMKEPAEEPQNTRELGEQTTQPQAHCNGSLMGPQGTCTQSGWGTP